MLSLYGTWLGAPLVKFYEYYQFVKLYVVTIR